MIRNFTLTRYIARRFLLGIMTTLGVCALLIFMIDFVELLRQSGKFGEVPALQLAWIALLRLPAYTEFLLGFAVLVGSIGALLVLNRKSELAVMRAGGMSVWQFLMPGILVAFLVGLLGVLVYNPLAATGRANARSVAFLADDHAPYSSRSIRRFLVYSAAAPSVGPACLENRRRFPLTTRPLPVGSRR
jgi:lipopolysaccharide export system permease protein